MKIPTQARLIEAFGIEQGTAVYRLAKRLDDCREHPAVVTWAEACYSDPRTNPRAYGECLMLAINAVLEGYGVETIDGRHVDNYHGPIQASYVNFGDTYDTTVLLDHETDRLQVTSWGDWVEAHGTRRQIA